MPPKTVTAAKNLLYYEKFDTIRSSFSVFAKEPAMAGFIFDPEFVSRILTQPIELEKEWKQRRGLPMTHQEKKAFYSPQELFLIEQESDRLYEMLSSGCVAEARDFTLSAGGPGSGKTTFLNDWVTMMTPSVYADPDETVLKNMVMYLDDLNANQYGDDTLAMAYTKWRPASQYICNTIINRAAADGFNITYGTTATGPAIKDIFDAVHQAGYKTNILIFSAPEAVRLESAQLRQIQDESRSITATDLVEKGKTFYGRLPVYFEKAMSFSLYFRAQADSASSLLAQGQNGYVSVRDEKGLAVCLADIQKHNPGFEWDTMVAAYASRFRSVPVQNNRWSP